MFKSWRNDKSKIKAVFKLQFQATQVPKLKKPALVITLVPEDGKPTFKLEKAAVQDGTCSWETPIFVSVKLVREAKTGKLHEKLYSFIVSSGSSKSGYLGESSIDFADFAEETEPLTVSLPLKFANSGAVLHLTIQKVEEDADGRYIEDHGNQTPARDGSLKSQLNNNGSFSEDSNLDLQNEEHDRNASFQELLRQDSIPRKESLNSIARMDRKSSADWSVGSDGSLADSNSPEDRLSRNLQDGSSESIEKLKAEITSLMRQSELAELEVQALRKQTVKESRRAQDLSREIVDLKEERDALSAKCRELKYSNKRIDEGESLNALRTESAKSRDQLEEIKRELSHEKELNGNLKLQLQKTQESNSELVIAVNDLDEELEQKNTEISHLSSKLDVLKSIEQTCKCNKDVNGGKQPQPDKTDDAAESYIMRKQITDLSDEVEAYREDREKLENYVEKLAQDYEDLKQENQVMSSELDQKELQLLQSQEETSELLSTVKDFESQVERLEETLKSQTHELSESFVHIDELESQVKGLKKELEMHSQRFESDLDAMTQAKIQLEQRAIYAEEALRKTRSKNALTAERLQEELRRVSGEMAGKLEGNEKLMRTALTESEELRQKNKDLEERLEHANEELMLSQDQNSIKWEEMATQLQLKTKHLEQMSLELDDVSKQLVGVKKHNKESQEASLKEIQLLRSQLATLMKEKSVLCEEEKTNVALGNELKQMKASHEEKNELIEKWNKERDELEKTLAYTKLEADKAAKENSAWKALRKDKEAMIKKLSTELESLRSAHAELKESISKGQLEKETLQQQLLQSRNELERRKHGSAISDKKLKNGYKAHGAKSTEPVTECKRNDKDPKVAPISRDQYNELLHEMGLLRDRNKSMELELKEMEERYSEISLKFAEVEGERQQLVMTVRNLKGRKN